MGAQDRQFLIDTNIWLELLLEQARADDAAAMLRAVPLARLYLTEFTLYSIGLSLIRHGRAADFSSFLQKNFVERSLERLRLTSEEMVAITETMATFNLDFDDAYQYVAAEVHDLILVSFDSDFDGTERGRKTPSEVLATLAGG